MYATMAQSSLTGNVVHKVEAAQIRFGKKALKVILSIHSDGFKIEPIPYQNVPADELKTTSRKWSPFTHLDVFSLQPDKGGNKTSCAAFTLYFLGEEVYERSNFRESTASFHFACSGSNAETERMHFMTIITSVLDRVCMSLIPHHSIQVFPLEGLPCTVLRILAGYLIFLADPEYVEVYYCELQAFACGVAGIAMYQDEWCERLVRQVPILGTTRVKDRTDGRESCTIFSVDDNLFSTSNPEDKDVWYRALCNTKVKVMFHVPEPDQEELSHIRDSIQQRISRSSYVNRKHPQQPLLEVMKTGLPRPVPPLGDFANDLFISESEEID